MYGTYIAEKSVLSKVCYIRQKHLYTMLLGPYMERQWPKFFFLDT